MARRASPPVSLVWGPSPSASQIGEGQSTRTTRAKAMTSHTAGSSPRSAGWGPGIKPSVMADALPTTKIRLAWGSTQDWGHLCGGTIARGLQGQFPDRFCLKRGCRFSTHAAKSSLGRLVPGAYYVKENNAYGYSELCLTATGAALAPEGLLASRNTMATWKAIIRQLEDQSAAGEVRPEDVAAQAMGLAGFAERVLKTSYAVTPLCSTCCRVRMDEDEDEVIGLPTTGPQRGGSVGSAPGVGGQCRRPARGIGHPSTGVMVRYPPWGGGRPGR